MPELPEVECVVRGLAPLICGKRLARPQLLRRDVLFGSQNLLPRVQEMTIHSVTRLGKRIILDFEHDDRTPAPPQMVFHLGMSGRLVAVHRSQEAVPHTHFVADIEGTDLSLRFSDPRRFGGIWLLDPRQDMNGMARRLSPLGPDVVDLDLRGFRAILARRRRIKALLMDQKAIAGLGNIYCDEALFRARLHPCRLADRLTPPQGALLWKSIRAVIRQAIAAGGSTIRDYRNANGWAGGFQMRHNVYGRENLPCRRCRSPILRIIVAGRSTHLCPQCQPEPTTV